MKKVIAKGAATTAAELLEVIGDLLESAKYASNYEADSDSVYVVNADTDPQPVRLALVEDTLSDGFKVYNIEVRRA